MNRQHVFNQVADHLLRQMAKSEGEDEDQGVGWCLYRGPHGRRCAIGCLIPDDVYTPSMEGNGIDDLLRDHPQALPFEMTDADICFLARLQLIHDDSEPLRWAGDLKALATENKLFGPIATARRENDG